VDDPYAILGVSRDAPLVEVAAAWRRLAKEWHPDLRGDANALARMVTLNAAYEKIRAERSGGGGASAKGSSKGEEESGARRPGARDRRPPGWWLSADVRRALGPELLRALRVRERVREVLRCHAGGSSAVLVLTESRLVWLLDDLVLGRVRSLGLASIELVERPRPRRWRYGAALRVRGGGIGVTFSGLESDKADLLASAIADANGGLAP
jgi:DnaJ domain